MEVSSKQAMLLTSLCVLIWSIGGLFIEILSWHPIVISGFHPLVAAVVTVIYMRSKDYWFVFSPCVLLAGLGLGGTVPSFVITSKLMANANAIILQFTNPVYIMIMSTVFSYVRYEKSELIVVVMAFAEIGLFFVDQLSPGNMPGSLIALLSGVTMSVMYLLSHKLPDEEGSMSSVLLGQTVAVVIGVSFTFFYLTPVTLDTAGVILVLGAAQPGIPYVLYAIAVRGCPALSCSLIGMIESLLNPVWVSLFMGEKPGFFALPGGAVVLVMVAVQSVINARGAASRNAA